MVIRDNIKIVTMNITIKRLNQEQFTVTIDSSIDNPIVGDLRKLIVEQQKFSNDIDMKIIYNRKVLEDNVTLKDAGIDGTNYVVIYTSKKKVVKEEKKEESKANLFQGDEISAPNASSNYNTQTVQGTSITENAQNTMDISGMQNADQLLQILFQNPEIQQIAQQNPEAIDQLIMNPNMFQNPMMFQNTITNTYTEEDKNNIKLLQEIGRGDYQLAVQCYESSGKNIEMSASLMMDMMTGPIDMNINANTSADNNTIDNVPIDEVSTKDVIFSMIEDLTDINEFINNNEFTSEELSDIKSAAQKLSSLIDEILKKI